MPLIEQPTVPRVLGAHSLLFAHTASNAFWSPASEVPELVEELDEVEELLALVPLLEVEDALVLELAEELESPSEHATKRRIPVNPNVTRPCEDIIPAVYREVFALPRTILLHALVTRVGKPAPPCRHSYRWGRAVWPTTTWLDSAPCRLPCA